MTAVDFLSDLGWRELVLAAAAIIGVYLVVSVMRLFRVAAKHPPRDKPKRRRLFSRWEPYSSTQGLPAQPLTEKEEPGFAAELAKSAVEAELDRLRRESAQQREELARLAEELARLKAARNVSPLYSEAMTLAQQGMPAIGIADHCGISIGEAELVAALAHSGSEFNKNEQGELRDDRDTDRET